MAAKKRRTNKKKKIVDRESLNNYPEQYLDCRDVGHAWVPVGVVAIAQTKAGWEIERTLQCGGHKRGLGCRTKRIDLYVGGVLMGRKYYWPDNFKLSGWKRADLPELRDFHLHRQAGLK